MDEIKIGGKGYKVQVTWGKLLAVAAIEEKEREKIFNKVTKANPDMDHEAIKKEIQNQFAIPDVLILMWFFLKRRWYWLKPFVFKRRMVNNVFPYELTENLKILDNLMSMEDREGKNLH